MHPFARTDASVCMYYHYSTYLVSRDYVCKCRHATSMTVEVARRTEKTLSMSKEKAINSNPFHAQVEVEVCCAAMFCAELVVAMCMHPRPILPADDQLKPIHPLCNRSRNACDAVATRGYQSVSGDSLVSTTAWNTEHAQRLTQILHLHSHTTPIASLDWLEFAGHRSTARHVS